MVAGAAYASPHINSAQKDEKRKRRQANNPYDIMRNVELAQQMAADGLIDDLSNLNNNNVFVLHAANDVDVPVQLGYEIKQYYKNISASVNVYEMIGGNFGHTYPDDGGETSQILNHLYGTALPNNGVESASLFSFSMTDFCPNGNCAAAGMHGSAFFAGSDACLNGDIQCPVHVYLHGCGGSVAVQGNTVAEMSDIYSGLVVARDMIAVFPQTDTTAGACWNVGWRWDNGQTGLENTPTGHLTYANPQAVTIKAMIDALTNN